MLTTALYENDVSGPIQLVQYIKHGVFRYGHKLHDLRKRLDQGFEAMFMVINTLSISNL